MIARFHKARDKASEALQRWSQWAGFYPLALLIIGVLTYLYALPWLGYFWDDWEVVFLLNAGDPELLAGYFAFDRPFAWPYQVMHALFGLNPIAWHIVTLLTRWGGILLLYHSLLQLWPGQRALLRWAGVLMLVYPGFLQQSISAAYNRHFAAFFVFALSVYLMVRAARSPAIRWIPFVISWALAFVHLFTIEYFMGLELIRPLMLWMLTRRDGKLQKAVALRKTLLLSLPYLLILGFYAYWRLIIFPTTIPIAKYAGDFKLLEDFEASALMGFLSILTRAFLDLIYGTLQVWLSALSESGAWTFAGRISWFALGLAASLALLFTFSQRSETRTQDPDNHPPRSVLWFGLAAFVSAAIPVWLTSKQLSAPGRWDDRFALAPMWGAALLTVWLCRALIRERFQRPVLAVLLGLSIMTQVQVVNRYRLDWAIQNAYYWQLAWRIPALQPRTAIISFEQPSASIPGYDASFGMNLLFGGTPEDGNVPYWFFTNDRFLNFELIPDKTINYKDRNLRFSGNTSEAISIIHQGQQRCLQILDAVYSDQPFYDGGQEQLVALSNVTRIVRAPAVEPPRHIFGPEPAHTWCYYFQKADLARQFGDWDGVLALEREARANGYAAEFGPELLPFIEAHAQLHDWTTALELSREAGRIVSEMEPLLCSTWSRLSHLSGADPRAIDAAELEFSCPAR